MKCSICENDCGNGSELTIKNVAETRCIKCIGKNPTKHQRIRSMSVDEIVKLFMDKAYEYSHMSDNELKLKLKQWLLQESEE